MIGYPLGKMTSGSCGCVFEPGAVLCGDVCLHKTSFVWCKEQMVALTRSQRAMEVRGRCARAVGLLAQVALTGGPAGLCRYRVGMISLVDRDLVIWLISFVVRSVMRESPPEGPWVEQESLALTELFLDDLWMLNVGPYLPPVLRNLLGLFRTGQLTRGVVRLIRACEERTMEVMLRVGFSVVDGPNVTRMLGRNRLVMEVEPELPAALVFEQIYQASSSSAGSTTASSGDCPIFDSDGNFIESSMGNSPEPGTEEEESGEPDGVGS